jgi:hypothetical protein
MHACISTTARTMVHGTIESQPAQPSPAQREKAKASLSCHAPKAGERSRHGTGFRSKDLGGCSASACEWRGCYVPGLHYSAQAVVLVLRVVTLSSCQKGKRAGICMHGIGVFGGGEGRVWPAIGPMRASTRTARTPCPSRCVHARMCLPGPCIGFLPG